MTSKPKYQTEPNFEVGIKARGYITYWEAIRICAWKSAKGVANFTTNTESFVESETKMALSNLSSIFGINPVTQIGNDDYWTQFQNVVTAAMGNKKTSGFLGLEGVGYPVATAFLAIIDPNIFPVYDRWVVFAVTGENHKQIPSKYLWTSCYTKYVIHLATHGPAAFGAGLNIHELDQRAMQLGMDAARKKTTPQSLNPMFPIGKLNT